MSASHQQLESPPVSFRSKRQENVARLFVQGKIARSHIGQINRGFVNLKAKICKHLGLPV
ncbi:hypothetical protein Q5691_19610 [Microcoleus sp. w1-18aA5]|uniref:hypothetical protein n=1 Tax=Microcoleus sp. w1-18aA5 TaxID=2818982 RepID=UPI002FCEEB83